MNIRSPREQRDAARSWYGYAKVGLLIVIAIEVVVLGWLLLTPASNQDDETTQPAAVVQDANIPKVQTDIMYSNRAHIWGIGFLPTGEMLFTERRGAFQLVSGSQTRELAWVRDVAYIGEGGLMGMVVDPQFATNRYIYACFNTGRDVRVARWTLPADLTTLTQRTDIVTGIPANPSGRHSGCAVAFGPDNYLYIGTGDSAQTLTPQSPQDPRSLAGKILRVSRDGAAAPGNLPRPYDARIFSYGHRNTQGLAFFATPRADGLIGVSAEHGSSVDDELNPLKAGNFGWAPPDGAYNEDNVPMTDTAKFPDAIPAMWRTGNPTQAPSGVAIIKGKQWKNWEGAVAMAVLKEKHLKIIELGDTPEENTVTRLLQAGFGRIRSVTQGPDGNLYIGTSNGVDDKIIKVTPL
jgi:glucose/arabinose dehydrogenase